MVQEPGTSFRGRDVTITGRKGDRVIVAFDNGAVSRFRVLLDIYMFLR